ncbi:MAG: beta-propeller domain-containing protein [Pyrodictiaceae archaeon]
MEYSEGLSKDSGIVLALGLLLVAIVLTAVVLLARQNPVTLSATTTITKTEYVTVVQSGGQGGRIGAANNASLLEPTAFGLKPASLRALAEIVEELAPEAMLPVKLLVYTAPTMGMPVTGAPAPIATTATVTAPTTTAGGLEYSKTNVQVKGVDEQDIVKTNGTLIYVASWDKARIFRAYPPNKLEKVEEIDINKLLAPLVGESKLLLVEDGRTTTIGFVKPRFSIIGLYAYKDKLVIIAREYRGYAWWNLLPRTWIILYKPGEGVVEVTSIDGYPRGSRLLGSKLVIVTRAEPRIAGGIILPRVNNEPINPNKTFIIGRPEAYTIITAIDLDKWSMDTLTILGPTTTVMYMTADGNIYLAMNSYIYRILYLGLGSKPINTSLAVKELANITRLSWDETLIAKIVLEDGPRLKPVAHAIVEGRVNKQWQLDEYKGVLRVVVENWEKGKLEVNIYTFNATTLREIGFLKNITINERVHGIRFMGEKLYIVTYRNVDPLFTIDLSNPKEPKVIGFLKGPGFDEYLHPLPGGFMLGVGVENKHVRLTLYKIATNGSLVVADRLYIGREEYEYSWSPVLNPREGHKAFLYDVKHGYILIPVSLVKVIQVVDEKGRIIYMKKLVGGVEVVRLISNTGEPRLEEKGLLEHSGAMRSLYIDDVLYTIAPYPWKDKPIVKAFDAKTLEEIASIS